MSLKEKIETKDALIGIVGLGYVGLPLAVSFADAGFRVLGADISEKRVGIVNRGESYIGDVKQFKKGSNHAASVGNSN